MSTNPDLSSDPINILLCANDDYAQHLAVTLASITLHHPNDPLNITIAGDLTLATKESLQEVAKLAQNCSLTFVGLHEIYETCAAGWSRHDLPIQGDHNIKGSYSIDIYTRLLVDHLFSKEKEKVLYLDSDLVVTGSLRPLWETDLLNYPIAGVPVPYFDRTHLPNLQPGDTYVNSGVLLFNMPAWRSSGCEKKCLAFIRDHQKILRDPDQDALNAALKGQIFPLAPRWNTFGGHLKRYMQKAEKAHHDVPVIYHFNGANKPWFYMTDHPMKHLYYVYLNETPWHSYTPPDKNLGNVAIKSIRRLTPSFLKPFARRLLLQTTPAEK